MFGIGFSELLIIMILVLILFGPDKLPEMANNLGKFMGMLKRNSDALRREFYNSVYTPAEELKNRIDESTRDLIGLAGLSPAEMNCEQKARLEQLEKEKAEKAAPEKQVPQENMNPNTENKDG